MALFRRKSSDSTQGTAGPGGPGGPTAGDGAGDFQPQPEKARKWFDHARTAAMASNHEYALSCFANGIRLDPEPMSAHEAMYKSAVQYAATAGRGASGKELKSLDDGTPVGRFASAEFAWMKDYNNAGLALKALEAAIKAGQHEFGNWAARPVLALLRRAKKPSKTQLATAKDLFAQVGAWNEAISAGEAALELDPSDNELANEIKDLAAQRAMDQGGYEAAGGMEGGFRKFVKDADRQRELEESESLAGATSVEERNLLRAKQAYEANPQLPEAINRYAQLLKKQDTDEALEAARRVYQTGYEQSGEYRFRVAAGDIAIETARRRTKEIAERASRNGEDAAAVEAAKKAQQALLDLEAREYRERAEKYPTDRPIKFQLGMVEFELGNYTDAMGSFQKAKDDPKLRVRAGHMLGRCFARQGWHSDAIAEFREALAAIDVTERERELEVRYHLMLSLIAHSREERSMDLAKEAREICSSIARRDISFRDISARRAEVEELVKELDS